MESGESTLLTTFVTKVKDGLQIPAVMLTDASEYIK